MTATVTFNTYINARNSWINGIAFAYVFGGYGVSLVLIGASAWYWNLAGVGLLLHTLLWAAYFVHELMHGNIFRRSGDNEAVGQLLLFLTGSCYCRYRDLARFHLAHHKNRADFSPFSLAQFLQSLPKPVLHLIIGLEWLYFPAVNLLLRWLTIVSPFLDQRRSDERVRTATLLLVRGCLFAALAWYSPRAVGLYFFTYLCFINILRFVDCFQHTYEVFQFGQTIPKFSLEYEEANTFSNVVSVRWRWLNLLLLNFGYHNAHHRVMRCPWYLLPKLDAQLYSHNYRQRVTLPQLVRNYHRFRIHRLFNGQGSVSSGDGLILDDFVGGVGVSFLVLREPLSWLNND